LEDCLRGLAECLRYQLPEKTPELPAICEGIEDVAFVTSINGVDVSTTNADFQSFKQRMEDRERQFRKYRFEEVMVRYRDILIEEAKQVSGGDAEQIRLAAEAAVYDKSKVQPLVELLATPDSKARVFEYNNKEAMMPNQSPEPTAVGADSSAVAVHVVSRRWLSFFR